MGIDPAKDAGKIAAGTINGVAKKVFGGVIGSVVGDEVLGFLGLGGSSAPDYTPYFEKLESQLDGVSDQLNQLHSMIESLQAGMHEVLADLADLTSEQLEAEMQTALIDFTHSADLISQNFRSYSAAVGALTSSDKQLRETAARDLFELYRLDNVDAIAMAMTHLQEMIVPALAAARSLPRLHLLKLSADVDNLSSKAAAAPVGTPWGNVVFGRTIYETCDATVAGELAKAVNTMRAFAGLQMQGLLIISSAWTGSDQEGQISQQCDSINRAMASIGSFGALACQGDAGFPGINKIMRSKMEGLATPFTSISPSQVWIDTATSGHNMPIPHPERKGPNPFNSHWLVWDLCLDMQGQTREYSTESPDPGKEYLVHAVATGWALSAEDIAWTGKRPSLLVGLHVEGPAGSEYLDFSEVPRNAFMSDGTYTIPAGLDIISAVQ